MSSLVIPLFTGTVNFMARTGDGPSGGLELPGDWQPQPSGGLAVSRVAPALGTIFAFG